MLRWLFWLNFRWIKSTHELSPQSIPLVISHNPRNAEYTYLSAFYDFLNYYNFSYRRTYRIVLNTKMRIQIYNSIKNKYNIQLVWSLVTPKVHTLWNPTSLGWVQGPCQTQINESKNFYIFFKKIFIPNTKNTFVGYIKKI